MIKSFGRVSAFVHTHSGRSLGLGAVVLALGLPLGAGLSMVPAEVAGATNASPTLTVSASPNPASPGASVTITADLEGGNSPTGDISLDVYTTTNCTGTAYSMDNGSISGNGMYTIGSAVPPGPNTYYVDAYYDGDGNNSPASTGCTGTSFVVNPYTTALTVSATPSSSVVGTSVTIKAHLSGGGTGSYKPTGSISVAVFLNNTNCGGTTYTLGTDNNVTSGNGTYTIGASVPPGVGTWYVDAYYTGDSNNSPAGTGCQGASFVVKKGTTGLTVSVTPNPDSTGTPATVSAMLSGGAASPFDPTGSIVVKGYTSSSCTGSVVFTLTNNSISGDGTYTVGTTTPPHNGTFYIQGHYSGDSNNKSADSSCISLVVTFPHGTGH